LLSTRAGQDIALEQLLSVAMQNRWPEPPDGLRVFFCGTSSPLPAPDRAQACVVVNAGDRLFLVDAGAGSARTAALGRVPLQQLQAILLTHFHSDHIASIYDFNLNSWVAGRPAPLTVIGPEGVDQVVDGFNMAYAQDRSYRVAHHGAELLPPDLGVLEARTATPGNVVDADGLTIRMFPVDHSPVAPAVGYRFDYRGRSVVVSGDTVVTTTLVDAARGADLLIQDGISLPIVSAMELAATEAGNTRIAKIFHDIQDYHAPVSGLSDLVEATGVRQLVVYHLVPPPQNLLMERIFRRDLPENAVLAEDGMIIDLPAGSTEIVIR
jgi:ribonuclease Z